jgi:hypothetical protein
MSPRQGLSSSVGPANVRPDKPGVLREVPTSALAGNLTGEGANWITVGLTVRIGAN